MSNQRRGALLIIQPFIQRSPDAGQSSRLLSFRDLAEMRQWSAVGVEPGSLLAMWMEVHEQVNPVVDRDPGEVSCRYEKELVREFLLFRQPCQRHDERVWRRNERGLPDRYPRLAPARLGWHPGLYL